MRKIILILILAFFSSQVFAGGWFSDKEKSKNVSDILSIQVDEGKWIFFPKDKLVLLLDESKKTVMLGYGNSEGEIISFWFDNPAEAKQFINAIYPNPVCLTKEGLLKCKSTNQLKIEKQEE
jgi:hypothetical protein